MPISSTKPRRRWFQFSLRTLLIVTTLVACVCGWVATQYAWRAKQVLAVKYLRDQGAIVALDYQFDELGVEISGPTPPGPAWLRRRLGNDFFANAYSVSGMDYQWTRKDADRLQLALEQLPYLKELRLNSTMMQSLSPHATPITDRTLERFKNLKQIEVLEIPYGEVSDSGLENLAGLTQLKTLAIHGSPIRGEGLKFLRGMTQLKTLSLCSSSVTNDGLKHLSQLTQLESLGL